MMNAGTPSRSCTWNSVESGILVRGRGLETLVLWEAPGIARVYCLPEGSGLGTGSAATSDLGQGRAKCLPEGPMLDPGRARTVVPFEVRETEAGIEMEGPGLKLSVDLDTGAFSWSDARGRLLVRESRRGGRVLDPVVLYRYDHSASETSARETADGIKTIAHPGVPVFLRNAYKTRLDLVFQEGEALFGLGQHEEGKLNYRGRCQYLYQQNMKVALPLLLSSRGYGILYNSSSPVIFRDDAFGSCFHGEADRALDFFVIAGNGVKGDAGGRAYGDACGSVTGHSSGLTSGVADGVVAGMRALTGRAALPPPWAFGYFQSKERYKNQEEILAVAREFRRRNLPLDCVVLDWLSWPQGLWGQKSFDPGRFPDPAAMTGTLHDMGVKFMISVWPHMQGESPDRREMAERGFLLGNGSTYDAFDPGARALYWKQAKRGLYDSGVDAWWCDCTEPFEADWKGKVKAQPEERMAINTRMAAEYLDPGIDQAYSLEHSRGIWEGQRACEDGKRVLNLTRSASLGQQRYGTFTWSGDVTASWETLRRQIPEGLNFCLSGMPYWTNDIGGFFVASKEQWFWQGDFDSGVDDAGYRELFLRWFQYGTFLPMMRAHGTDTPREPWRFGEPGDEIYEALARFLRLRRRLKAYLYSLAGAVTFADYTMMRALVFDFPEDSEALGVEDQFMLGGALMVCPVTEPQRFGPGSRPIPDAPATKRVYLPGPDPWADFWTGEPAGPGWVEASAPLRIIPVFMRAGAILPLAAEGEAIGASASEELEILVYPGRDGHFRLYEDSGDGYGYESGEYATTDMAWNDAPGRLEIADRVGSFPGMAERRNFVLRIVRPGFCPEGRP